MSTTPDYLCPLCKTPLFKIKNSYQCDNKHNFDIAKQGYVNLLPVQHKKSKKPGDNKLMIRTRRDFLNMGYYDFLIEPAIELIAKHSHAPRQLLDIGCGDGYFTNSIFSALEYEKAYGLDISSEALKVAAKRNPDIHWCVASNRDIPLPPNSVSCILKINTPTNLQSINTVLKDEGFILSVTPGPRHLDGLKKLIYENPQLHEREPAFSTYVLVDEVLTETQLLINNNEDIQALFLMTPYAWNASNAAKEKIQQLATLETHVSFQLSLWQKQKETL